MDLVSLQRRRKKLAANHKCLDVVTSRIVMNISNQWVSPARGAIWHSYLISMESFCLSSFDPLISVRTAHLHAAAGNLTSSWHCRGHGGTSCRGSRGTPKCWRRERWWSRRCCPGNPRRCCPILRLRPAEYVSSLVVELHRLSSVCIPRRHLPNAGREGSLRLQVPGALLPSLWQGSGISGLVGGSIE